MIPATADLTPTQRAAAFHGLATNASLQPADRLQCALQALDLYEAEVKSLRGQLAEAVTAGRTAAAADALRKVGNTLAALPYRLIGGLPLVEREELFGAVNDVAKELFGDQWVGAMRGESDR